MDLEYTAANGRTLRISVAVSDTGDSAEHLAAANQQHVPAITWPNQQLPRENAEKREQRVTP